MVGGGLVAFLDKKSIVVTGSSGFFGKALIEKMYKTGIDKNNKIVGVRSKEFDLRDSKQAIKALEGADVVINLAANVGGIGYNQKYPGKLFLDNILMGINVIESARINDVKKLVQIGTVCSYPKVPPHIPFKEIDIWEGFPEETNAPYGIAKKSLITMGDAYRAQYGMNIINLIMVNLYGPGDNFNEQNSHVIPALVKKFIDSKRNDASEVVLWGSGKVSREFIYIEDAAAGVIQATEAYNENLPLNIGTGKEITIEKLAEIIAQLVGYKGKIVWNKSMPDGQPRRLLDISMAQKKIGFNPQTDFEKGLRAVIDYYVNLTKVSQD
jgi:GDP-L-fucose synthase